ncbi:MAG: leucine-rich repeat domain-containing protein [Bacteroidales bacterium]|nr:leucine-rich repeat domain-containing protein [Bacteroidales bacterium]
MYIPKTINYIADFYLGEHVFDGCSSLSTITIDPENTVFDSRNDCNAIIETSSNTLIVGCNNTVIPNSIVEIGDGAFNKYSGLTSMTIPNSVIKIGNSAFSNCTGLISLTIPNSVTKIGNYAFSNCTGLISLVSTKKISI